jgi:hypothetical protein
MFSGRCDRLAVFLVDLEIHLFSMDTQLGRSLHAEPDSIGRHRQHGDLHVVPDHDALPRLTGKN